MGWTYPDLQGKCEKKKPKVVALVKKTWNYMTQLNVEGTIDSFLDLVELSRKYPRCYYLTNIPVTGVYTVAKGLANDVLHQLLGSNSLSIVYGAEYVFEALVIGTAQLIDVFIWLNDMHELNGGSKNARL